MSDPLEYSRTPSGNDPAEGNMPAGQVSDNLRQIRAGVANAIDFLSRIHTASRSVPGGQETYVVSVTSQNVPQPGSIGGQSVHFIPGATNTTRTPYLRINNNTARRLVRSDGSNPFVGDLRSGQVYAVAYNISTNQWYLVGTPTTLFPANTITQTAARLDWNVGLNPNATVLLSAALNNIVMTGDVDGGVYTLMIQQQATANYPVTFPAGWYGPNDPAQVRRANNARAILTVRRHGTEIFAVLRRF